MKRKSMSKYILVNLATSPINILVLPFTLVCLLIIRGMKQANKLELFLEKNEKGNINVNRK